MTLSVYVQCRTPLLNREIHPANVNSGCAFRQLKENMAHLKSVEQTLKETKAARDSFQQRVETLEEVGKRNRVFSCRPCGMQGGFRFVREHTRGCRCLSQELLKKDQKLEVISAALRSA